MKKLFLPVFAIVLLGLTFAHQPRLVFQQPIGQITTIQNPEISQAFYGILSGQEDVYQIVSTTGFLLYINLVVPDLSGAKTDFMVDILEGNDAVYTRLDGTATQWSGFFEKFAGDFYLQGPKREKYVGPGTYTIKISNKQNQGKYSLAIGKIESFPFKETIKTFKAMPALKIVFFQKPRYTIFSNYVGGFFILFITITIVLIWLGSKLVYYIKNK